MPPKKRNAQFESARCEKKLKKTIILINPIALLIKVFFQIQSLLILCQKLIQGLGYENEFSDLQLSDSDSGDDNWNNEAQMIL